ncbi:MAG: protein arginine kinase [Clostridia bacterium]|nr:protein arginine kinase [Clostridia bacterium]
MWYEKFGPMGDIVLSSRVRLARNIEEIPFGTKMTDNDRSLVIDKCKTALPHLKFIDLQKMESIEKLALSECHLISPEIANSTHICGLLTNDSCNLCVMLNEEDHIRIQAMCEGFDLESCLKAANDIDDKLEETVNIAFDSRFGYLTCCPTNTGTGMRASVMLHLPALSESGDMEQLIRSLSKLGFTVRGIYGEGSQALGNIYQISNQVTLGISEEETIQKLKQVINEVIEKERSVSRMTFENNKLYLEDKIMRAKGLITNARIMSSSEAMNLLSYVRWGINLGIINDINLETLSEALYQSLPANIAKKYNSATPTERDLKRSEIFRRVLVTK